MQKSQKFSLKGYRVLLKFDMCTFLVYFLSSFKTSSYTIYNFKRVFNISLVVI